MRRICGGFTGDWQTPSLPSPRGGELPLRGCISPPPGDCVIISFKKQELIY